MTVCAHRDVTAAHAALPPPFSCALHSTLPDHTICEPERGSLITNGD